MGRDFDLVLGDTLYAAPLAFKAARGSSAIAALRIHNVEAEYVSSISWRPFKEAAYKLIGAVEGEVLRRAGNLIAISARDAEIVEKLYGVRPAFLGPTLRVVRGGCEEAEKILRILGLSCGGHAIFVGGGHRPSVDALRETLRELRRHGAPVKLAVVGRSGEILWREVVRTPGARALGRVGRRVLEALYCCAEVSLAPIVGGSGVPIKLVEALLHGLPTITSERALKVLPWLRHGINVFIAEKAGGLGKALEVLMSDHQLRERLRKGADELDRVMGYKASVRRYVEYFGAISKRQPVDHRRRRPRAGPAPRHPLDRSRPSGRGDRAAATRRITREPGAHSPQTLKAAEGR